ncbi:hypothetical protein B1H10_02170 [candidate division KSB1 bacterium 4484_188]|nr:MAG: hypothetical protein B1H10_02170 [candidate division KSB1 bacterium 4484_188]
MKKKNKKSYLSWYLLSAVVLTYLFLFLFAPDLFNRAALQFLKLLKKMIPVLAGVFLLIFVINLYLKPKKIVRHLGQESGFKGILLATVAGVISTGPIYVWYPLLADLREKGMINSLITIFLYNRAVKIPLLPMMIYYFGISFTVTLTVLMILFAGINGWAVEKITGRKVL